MTNVLLKEVVPTAPHLRIDETFTYSNPNITNLGYWFGDLSELVDNSSVVSIGDKLYKLNDGISVNITGTYINGLLHRTNLTLTVPCKHNDSEASIVNQIRVSDIGDITITRHLHDNNGNIKHIPITHEAQFIDEISAALEILIKEHQSLI